MCELTGQLAACKVCTAEIKRLELQIELDEKLMAGCFLVPRPATIWGWLRARLGRMTPL